MLPVPPDSPDVSHASIRTAKYLLVGYALLSATFVALWVASYPIIAAALVGSAVAVITAVAVLLGAVGRLRDERPRRICVPGTSVCVDV